METKRRIKSNKPEIFWPENAVAGRTKPTRYVPPMEKLRKLFKNDKPKIEKKRERAKRKRKPKVKADEPPKVPSEVQNSVRLEMGDGKPSNDHQSTPRDLYDALDAEFHFDFDPCPLHGEENFNGLTVEWYYCFV